METRQIENADGARPLSAAARSLSTWFEREASILRGAIAIAREHLAVHPDDGETRTSLAELEQQRSDLYAGWERSSVRRHMEQRVAPATAASATERRVNLATPSDAHLASGPRAAAAATATTTAKQLVGYAAVFNRSADIGYFRERIVLGAFAQAIKTSDVRFLFNHDSNFIYGRSTASTLELLEDRVGLRFTCHLLPFDATSYALARRVDRMDISGCSFSFTVRRDSWKLASKFGELDERTILGIEQLFDVGPVTYPAYSQTSVHAVFEKVPGRSVEYDSGVGNDEFYAERDDRLLAQQRERDRKFDYQEMGRTIREVDRWLALRS